MTTTAQQLQLVDRHWNDLQALRTSRPHDAWPPPSLQTYQRTIEEYDPADRSAPVRLHITDTMRAVEAALVDLADQIAADVQRPVIGATLGRGWTDEAHKQAVLLSARDSADTRRWQLVGTRTAPEAARWLHDRVQGAPGPFRPLTAAHRERIALVAAGAAERVEHALGISRRTTPTGHTCACGGQLLLHGGDGNPPAITCDTCQATIGARAA
ncbi:hypothetical protein [Streptomyces sp. NPDC059071]|uniref:hypothetical protein n=1 Tax=unclassified Streptomyces TaxID=2593676 RepID=UPI003652C1BE